jgi:hypothetical protein
MSTSESDDLFESMSAVTDEVSLLRFLKLLVTDREAAELLPVEMDGHQGQWANSTIHGFLEAVVAWTEDSEFGRRSGPKSDNA